MGREGLEGGTVSHGLGDGRVWVIDSVEDGLRLVGWVEKVLCVMDGVEEAL